MAPPAANVDSEGKQRRAEVLDALCALRLHQLFGAFECGIKAHKARSSPPPPNKKQRRTGGGRGTRVLRMAAYRHRVRGSSHAEPSPWQRGAGTFLSCLRIPRDQCVPTGSLWPLVVGRHLGITEWAPWPLQTPADR